MKSSLATGFAEVFNENALRQIIDTCETGEHYMRGSYKSKLKSNCEITSDVRALIEDADTFMMAAHTLRALLEKGSA